MESMHGAEGQIRLAVLDGNGSMRNLAGSIVDAMDHPCATPVAYQSFEPFYAASTQVRPDVMIVDLETLGQDGHLSRLAAAQPQAFLMAVSTGQSLSRSLSAMEAGAHDVISAGVDPVSAAEKIDRFLIQTARPSRVDGTRRPTRTQSLAARADDVEPHRFETFIGGSARMREVYDQIERMAPSSAPVFITGESGSGKELCASAIHSRSPRRDRPFIAINCAAIPGELMESEIFGHMRGAFTGATETREGAAEAADGGTLFLDEIGEMDLALQSKLLRFVQTGTVQRIGDTHQRVVNVRIVCATNRDPLSEISEGRFREDLFYRLHVLPVRLPALRDRREDILPLAQSFLSRFCAEEGRRFLEIAGCAGEKLLTYDWPGNVRQLENAIRQAVVLHDGEALRAEMLPGFLLGEGLSTRLEPLSGGFAARSYRGSEDIEPLWAQERRIIETALTAFDGNIAKAAAALEISPSTIYRKRQSWTERMGGTAAAFTAFAG
ncbi:sigma-54 dependent transcriptional regulator [Stappia sp. ES.058]|uniref:sigma-54-dependent transcriptional regulator n=1 Tax=Stappia sp. ES.058 TaxID=1881061 RepID=UPI00087CD691|nr:sigma-54 dependent transcriptional regulator [Stappia sp. ES.058]SDT91364.1 two-component system, repressor protein LuxO [Stappia sp. ES.058]